MMRRWLPTRAQRKNAEPQSQPEPEPKPSTSVPAWLEASSNWSWRFIVVIAAIAIIVFGTSQIQLIFIAIFLGLVITAVLRPLVDLLHRFMPRPLATALGFVTSIAVVGGLVTYVVASVAGQWESLSEQFSNGVTQIITFLKEGPLKLQFTEEDLNTWLESGRAWVEKHSGDIASTAFAQVGTAAKVFTALALAIFCAVFFLTSGRSMWQWFVKQLPRSVRPRLAIAADAGWATFSGYTRGTVLIALTDGILAGVFLAVIGVPLAAPLGVLVFIGAFIPLIGAPAAMVVAMVVALAADGVWKAVIVGVGIALIGQFEGHVLQPWIMGKQVALHPVVIGLVVASGTLLAGIIGAVVSVPLVAVIWSIFSHLRKPPEELDTVEP